MRRPATPAPEIWLSMSWDGLRLVQKLLNAPHGVDNMQAEHEVENLLCAIEAQLQKAEDTGADLV